MHTSNGLYSCCAILFVLFATRRLKTDATHWLFILKLPGKIIVNKQLQHSTFNGDFDLKHIWKAGDPKLVFKSVLLPKNPLDRQFSENEVRFDVPLGHRAIGRLSHVSHAYKPLPHPMYYCMRMYHTQPSRQLLGKFSPWLPSAVSN